MENKKIAGKKLREARGEKTQEDVAKAVGISLAAVSMYEQGQRMPRDEVKLRLANYFNTTVEALFFSQQHHEV